MKEKRGTVSLNEASFRLRPQAPFRLDYTVWALRRRPGNIVDRWDGVAWRRVVADDGTVLEVQVTQTGDAKRPVLNVRLLGEQPPVQSTATMRALLGRMLGLGTDLSDFYRLARGHRKFDALAEAFRGARLPRFPSVFEALVNGICCQQLSLTVGITILNRLAEACGDRLDTPGGAVYGFPRPQVLAGLEAADLKPLGFSRQKAEALVSLSRQVADNAIDLEGLGAMGDEEARSMLLRLRGVGRWTADYALLRGLGRAAVFPRGDVGARNRLQGLLHARKPLDDEAIDRRLRDCPGFAGLVYIHLLLSGLCEEGRL